MAVLLSTILTRAQRDMVDYSTAASTTQFVNYMSEMERDIYTNIINKTLLNSTSLSGTTDYAYSYPTGITFDNIIPKGVYHNNRWYKKIDAIKAAEIDTDNDSKYVCWNSSTALNLNPTPSTTDYIKIPYRYVPTEFTGTSEYITLPDDFASAYVYYAQAKYSRDVLRDYDKSEVYMEAYAKEETRIKRWWSKFSEEEDVATISDEYVSSY